MSDATFSQLIVMSHDLGRSELQLAILGEGNTSALCDGEQFLVKASGSMLSTIDESGFARLDRPAAEGLLDCEMDSDAEIMDALLRVCIGNAGRRPSIEAMMHAYLLGLPDVNFVGHTHPISVNALLCSVRAEELAHVCLFPDQIVCCGPAPVFIPYSDPGLPLARLVRERVLAYIDTYQTAPKAILLQNHGFFALGKTAQQVLSCTLMWDKTARVIAGAMACGGVNPMKQEQIDRIYTRPDEKFREQVIGKG